MASPHALVFPFPAQSHIMSLLELSYCLLDRGFRVTFLVSELDHGRLLATLDKENGGSLPAGIRLASIPDGLGPEESRNDIGRLTEGIMSVMVGCLEELIVGSYADGDERFTCLVADQSMAWAFDVAKKTGLRSVAFFPASATILAMSLNIQKLIEDGVIDEQGLAKREGKFQLSPEMAPMDVTTINWNCFPNSRRKVFDFLVNNNRAMSNAEFIACNTFNDLEELVLRYTPSIVPIGPLYCGCRPEKPAGNFWLQDASCVEWLNQHPVGSVVYVAFGSITIVNRRQFEELALGLELTGRPFLWVVRPDLTDNAEEDPYPPGFLERVGGRGRTVGWSPQQKVVAHPSVACFISHCGWNSTLEGVRNGLPFLCWPYFADQFSNQEYICDVWRVGVRLTADGNGIYTREEIRSKVEELLGDDGIKSRCSALKQKACRSVEEGGSSIQNLDRFVEAMKHV